MPRVIQLRDGADLRQVEPMMGATILNIGGRVTIEVTRYEDDGISLSLSIGVLRDQMPNCRDRELGKCQTTKLFQAWFRCRDSSRAWSFSTISGSAELRRFAGDRLCSLPPSPSTPRQGLTVGFTDGEFELFSLSHANSLRSTWLQERTKQ